MKRFRFFSSAGLLVGSVLAASMLSAQEPAQAPKGPPDTLILKPPTQGVVTFAHKKHSEMTDCVTCHHESKPEKAKTADQQACTDCHTKPAEAPMKTALRDAFHNGMAKEGTCVDCHTKAAAEGKTVPRKCSDCHAKKETQ